MTTIRVELPGYFQQEVFLEGWSNFNSFQSLSEKELCELENHIFRECRENLFKCLQVQKRNSDGNYVGSVGKENNLQINEEERKTTDLCDKNLTGLIYQVQTKFMSDVPQKEVFDYLLENLLELMGSEYGFIGEVHYEDGKPLLQAVSITDISWSEETKKTYETVKEGGFLFRNVNSLFGQVMVTCKPVISNDPKKDPRSAGTPKGHPELKCFLGVPLMHQNELLGMYGMANRKGGFSTEIIDFLKPFTVTCANMIRSMRINNKRKAAEQELVNLVDKLEHKVYQRTQELEEINKHLESEIVEKTLISQRLEEAKLAAEKSLQTKSQFVACITHELRTPMNSVLGMARLLMETNVTQEQQDYLTTILDSGHSLLVLIDDILDFSKIESGHLVIHTRTANISHCVESCMDKFSDKAFERGIEILYDYNIDSFDNIITDEARLSQVFINLIGNSVKFTNNNGHIYIRSKVNEVSGDDVIIEFSVEDNGIGITPEYKQNIFKPFIQGDASITRKYGGTGLGLAITKKIVELLGGSIWFESESNVGSTFYFTIKCKKQEPVQPPVEIIKAAEQIKVLRVVVLEENDFKAGSIVNCLLRQFAVKEVVKNYEECLKLVTTDRIDVLLLPSKMYQEKAKLQSCSKNSQIKIGILYHPFEMTSSLSESPYNLRIKYSDNMKEMRRFLGLEQQHWTKKRKTQPTFVNLYSEIPIEILIVEDNLVNQKVITQALKNFGFAPSVVGGGNEAIRLCSGKTYDLILMDIQMPDIDGFQTTKSIRSLQDKSKRKSVIIALTANAMSGVREACLEAGMDDYLKKPIDFDELRNALQHWGSILLRSRHL